MFLSSERSTVGRWGHLLVPSSRHSRMRIAAERKGACPRQWYTSGRKAWPGSQASGGEDGTPGTLSCRLRRSDGQVVKAEMPERAPVPRGVRADSRVRPRHSWLCCHPWLLAGPCQGGAVWCGRKHTWFFQIQDTWVLGSTLTRTRHVNLSGHQFLHRQNAQVRWEDIYSPDTDLKWPVRPFWSGLSYLFTLFYPVRSAHLSLAFTSHTHTAILFH